VSNSALQELRSRIDGIEEGYEFMLAYAAQGVLTHEASGNGAQLLQYLNRTGDTLRKLADLFQQAIDEGGMSPREGYADFVEVIREDARKAGAAVRLALIQPKISSQLIDNLNASIHLRALLTDIFLLDEIISPRRVAAAAG
jgi:phytoene dehydrogenase-like protein